MDVLTGTRSIRAEPVYHKKHAIWRRYPGIRPVFRLHELITPQIDHFDESRFWRDLTPQFVMVEGVGTCRWQKEDDCSGL